MNTKTKELIDNMLNYLKYKEAKGCFNRNFKEIENNDIHLVVRRIIGWQIFLARGLEVKSYEFNPYETKNNAEKILYPKFKVIFDNCKDINKVFKLNKSGVEWNEDITNEEQSEITTYIDNNYEPPPRSIYRRVDYRKE